jgi:hypothetical protein
LNYFCQREQTDRLHRAYDRAAYYPEVVALTSVLASPYWRRPDPTPAPPAAGSWSASPPGPDRPAR